MKPLARAAAALRLPPRHSHRHESRPPITGIAHIVIYVHDIGKARAFYPDFLGYDEPYSFDNPDGNLSMTFSR